MTTRNFVPPLRFQPLSNPTRAWSALGFAALSLGFWTSCAFAAPVSRGKVVDENGKPLAGATVVLGKGDYDSDFKISATLASDKSGTFALPPNADKNNPTWIGAWSPNRAIATSFSSAKTPLVLRPTHNVRVRLVDLSGKPVKGALLSLTGRYPTNRRGQERAYLPVIEEKWPLPFQTRSDAQGRALVPFGASGDLVLMKVERAGFQTIALRQNVPDENDLTVRLVPEARLRGRLIRGATGQPLSGKIELSGQSDSSDASGRFTLTGLDETSSYLRLKSDDLVLPLRMWQTRRGQGLDVGDIKATPGCLVSGRVLRQGKPLASAYVTVQSQSTSAAGGFDRRPFQTLRTDAKGAFQLRLPAGAFTLNAFDNTGRGNVIKPIQATEGAHLKVDLMISSPNVGRTIRYSSSHGSKAGAERVEYLSGEVINSQTKQPVVGAQVQAYGNGQLLHSAKTNDKGLFALGNFATTGPDLPRDYVLVVQAPGLVGMPTVVEPTREKPISLAVSSGIPLALQLLSSEGKPIAGVGVTITGFTAAPGLSKMAPNLVLPPGALQGQSDAEGKVVFPSLPESGSVELKTAAHAGFATDIFSVALSGTGEKTHQLARETVVTGRVMLGTERPFSAPGLRVKAQSWSYPWAEYENWRMGNIAPDGSFQISNVPSLESLGEPSYGINLDLQDLGYGQEREVAPGVKVAYVNGWNMMVTLDHNGRTERWISFVEARERGLKYSEGARLKHDMVLQPLALLRGQLPANLVQRGRRDIWYRPPLSIYGDWRVSADSEGRFEIPVPVGNVTVNFPDGARTLTGLKAHEVRVVDFQALKPKALDPRRAMPRSYGVREITIRVLGPDGATIPRPRLVWKNPGRNFVRVNDAFFSQMDGTVSLWGAESNAPIDLSSPDLDKPVRLVPKAGQTHFTIRFNRVPKAVPPDPYTMSVAKRRAVSR